MTFSEKFNELKALVPKIKDGTFKEDFAIQVNMTDDDCGGIFYIANIGGVFSFEPYDYHDHTALVTVSADLIKSLLEGKTDPVSEYMLGRLHIEGNLEHIKQLGKLAKKPRNAKSASVKTADGAEKKKCVKKASSEGEGTKKPTAKKTPAKKTASKTEK